MTTLHTPPNDAELPGMQTRLTARLSRLAVRVRALIAFDALVRGLAVLLGLLTLSLVLDFWLELSAVMRGFYWLITLAAAAHFLYHFGLKPLSRKLGPIELAQAVDVAQGHAGEQRLAPRVATVLQLPGMFDDGEAYSAQMIRDAVGRSYRSLEQADLSRVVSKRHTMQCSAVLLAALFVPGLVGAVMNSVGDNVIGTWAQRWLSFADTPYPRNTSIEVIGLNSDGQLIIPAGENVTLRTRIANKDAAEVHEPRLTFRPENAKRQTQPLTRFDTNDFRVDLLPLTEPARATLRAGDQSLAFEIIPAARPRLTGLKLTYRHPASPDVVNTIDFNGAEGEIALLELNEVELLLTANVPIAEARYAADRVEDETAAALPPIQRVGPNAFKISWTHKTRQRLRVELVSETAGLVSQPIPIGVGLKTDRKPSVRVRTTGVTQRITPNALIPMSVEARDDFGLLDMGIAIKREWTGDDKGEKTFDPITLHEDALASLREVRDKYEMEIDQFEVQPTDVIRITGIATDDRYVGKQVGESTTLTFRIVTHKELFREIIARQQQARSAFRQAIEHSKDLKTALVKAQTGPEAAAQARRFRTIQRNVWKVNRELERSAEEMRLNRLGGTKEDGNKAYESMKATVLNPLARLHDQTMAQQRAALEAAGSLDQAQLPALAQGQQAVVDEMTALLARMDRWDELLDAINQLSEVIDQQQQLKDKLDKLVDEEIDDLFD